MQYAVGKEYAARVSSCPAYILGLRRTWAEVGREIYRLILLCRGFPLPFGSKLLGEVLGMKESGSKLHKTTKERLIAARKRRLERESRGTDEEYIKCITEEYEILNLHYI